jgi:hypothetical protein
MDRDEEHCCGIKVFICIYASCASHEINSSMRCMSPIVAFRVFDVSRQPSSFKISEVQACEMEPTDTLTLDFNSSDGQCGITMATSSLAHLPCNSGLLRCCLL